MKINTYAKINLNLKISKDIEDGLHNLSSLIIPIDLYDSIEIKETNADVDKIQFDKEGISEENTISKSLNFYMEDICQELIIFCFYYHETNL